MKDSLIVLLFFVLGVAAGRWGGLPAWLASDALSFGVLCALLFGVAFTLGCTEGVFTRFRRLDRRLLLLPVATLLGTWGGCAVASLLLPARPLADCLAVASGLGYYSLSSVLITRYSGAEWGTVALLANIEREMIALLLAPLLVRCFGPLAPMSVGGATSMDTTLPVSVRCAGPEYAPLAVYHGFLMDCSVFFTVTLFCNL